MTFFDEDNRQKQGVVTCPKCMREGLPPLRIMHILAPDVFLSYHWGQQYEQNGRTLYRTQEIVRKLRQPIEVGTDVLCWLDIEGGVTPGQDHLKEIQDGVVRATVVVVFLTDGYVLSPNCNKEYHTAISNGKFLIPVLLDGWSDTTNSHSSLWWEHACKLWEQRKQQVGSAKVIEEVVDWEGMRGYTPVDMRKLSQEEGEREVVKRILERFHKGSESMVKMPRGRRKWRKLKMVHRMSSSKFMLHKSNSLNSMPPPRQQHSFTEEKSNGSAKWGAGGGPAAVFSQNKGGSLQDVYEGGRESREEAERGGEEVREEREEELRREQVLGLAAAKEV